jgi:hypothetical protein
MNQMIQKDPVNKSFLGNINKNYAPFQIWRFESQCRIPATVKRKAVESRGSNANLKVVNLLGGLLLPVKKKILNQLLMGEYMTFYGIKNKFIVLFQEIK